MGEGVRNLNYNPIMRTLDLFSLNTVNNVVRYFFREVTNSIKNRLGYNIPYFLENKRVLENKRGSKISTFQNCDT